MRLRRAEIGEVGVCIQNMLQFDLASDQALESVFNV